MKYLLSLIIGGALVVSGFGQTRNVLVGTNNAVVQPTNFWSADASNARTGLGLDTAATNPATAFQPSSLALSNLASSNGGVLTNIQASNIVGTIAISNGGTGATTAGGARTNLGLGVTNMVRFAGVVSPNLYSSSSNALIELDDDAFILTAAIAEFRQPILFDSTTNAATTRTNLGLGWSALTNSNSGTGLVSVNTNGEVISPTNFWQAAPITTTFIESQPNTNFTTNITAARFLHIHSLATNIVNVTNTIVLPTNGTTFDGDIALVVHQGPTNSMTRVRTAGSTNDLVTMTRFDEAVEFVYYNNVWQFNHNQSFIEPIYFSGTNAAANAAASRTNLGLGTTNNVEFAVINATSVDSSTFFVIDGGTITFEDTGSIVFNGAAAATRTNLGLGWSALTNTNAATTLLGYTTNGQVVYSGTNALHITNDYIKIDSDLAISNNAILFGGSVVYEPETGAFYTDITVDPDKSLAAGTDGTNSIFVSISKTGITIEGGKTSNVVELVGTNLAPAIRQDLGLGTTNNVSFSNVTASGTLTATGVVTTVTNLNVGGAIAVTNAAETRTNLGIPLAALTNTTVTNFHQAIFYTNTAPTNVGGNLGTIAAWIEIVASNGVTYKIPAYTNVP